jgi:hypothetical protein
VSFSLEDRASARPEFGSWKVLGLVLAVAIATILLATAAGFGAAAAFDLWTGLGEPRAFAAGEREALLTARVAVSLFAFQCVTVVLVFVANAHFRRAGASFLRFGMPPGGIGTLAFSVLWLMLLAALYGGFVYVSDQQAFRQDVGPFAELMKARNWWLILIAAGIGAPLAEECLFRGFLFGALRQTPIGLFGAALVTAVMWAALHANYSAYGLVAITLIGLYLAYVRERTGTLLTPLVCHGVYNSLIVVLLAFAPENSFLGGY